MKDQARHQKKQKTSATKQAPKKNQKTSATKQAPKKKKKTPIKKKLLKAATAPEARVVRSLNSWLGVD